MGLTFKEKAAERQAARAKAREEGKRRLSEVVIPYFAEVKAQIKFDVTATDRTDGKPVRVTFHPTASTRVHIALTGGRVTICRWTYGGRTRGGPPLFIYRANSEPFISRPSDLTREKLSKLIEMEMDHAK